MNTSMPPTGILDTPSYFAFSQRRRNSTSSSTQASPTTENPTRMTPPTMRPTMVGHHRSRSDYDYDALHARVKDQTIEEHHPSLHASRKSDTELQRQFASPFSARSISQGSRFSSRKSSLRSVDEGRVQVQSRSATPPSGSNSSLPPGRARAGHRWSRTPSGGVWYEKRISSERHSKKSSGSSRPSDQKRDHSVVTPVPLRPPAQPNLSGSGYYRKITLETDFTEKGTDTLDESAPPVLASRRTSRKSRDILIAPFTFIRRLSKRNESTISISPNVVTETEPEQLDHGTSQKSTPTGKALLQVSALLHDLAGDRVNTLPRSPTRKGLKILNSRTMSAGSASTKQSSKRSSGSRDATKRSRTLSGLMSFPFSKKRDKEMSDVASYTSSIRQFKMGKAPNVTPDEEATYKIKKSSSADTEEFFKIEISVRGGTSYLPSEARRIHTPPLPEDGPGGKKRGFFFDYDAPSYEEEKYRAKKEKCDRKKSSNERPKWNLVASHPNRLGQVGKVGEWFEVKLAEIDSSSGSSEESLLYGARTQEDEFDDNIPDHLPTSPLCPRHPRYWRIVDGKGNRYRGCWMHGVGIDITMGRR